MIKLINETKRALGFPGAHPFALGPGESQDLTKGQLKALMENRTVARWLDKGLISTKPIKPKVTEKSDKPKATKSQKAKSS